MIGGPHFQGIFGIGIHVPLLYTVNISIAKSTFREPVPSQLLQQESGAQNNNWKSYNHSCAVFKVVFEALLLVLIHADPPKQGCTELPKYGWIKELYIVRRVDGGTNCLTLLSAPIAMVNHFFFEVSSICAAHVHQGIWQMLLQRNRRMFDSLQSHCPLNQFVRNLPFTLLSFTIVHNIISFSVILIAGECVRKDAYEKIS